jgi:hypothetical protein
MTTPAALAIVNGLLTPNLRGALPFVIMLLMIQDIHPEIIFELISHVQISQLQYNAIIMALTQLRLFASLLPAVKGVNPPTFGDQRARFRILHQDKVSRIFADFQDSVLSRILVKCGFAGTLPSLEVVQHFVSNLAVVHMSPCQIFPIGQLFLAPDEHLILLKTALQMQSMIAHVRSSYPEIVSFLARNENTLKNFCMVLKNHLDIMQIRLDCINFYVLECVKMNDLYILCILAVIDPEFDQTLTQVIQNCGYPNGPYQDIQKYSQFLTENCQSIAPMIFGHFLNIGSVLNLFSTMGKMKSKTRPMSVEYTINPWSMTFRQIVYSGKYQFEKEKVELGSSVPFFEIFCKILGCFFQKFCADF